MKKCSKIIYRLVAVILVCLCSIKVKAGCPKQLGKDAFSQLKSPLKGMNKDLIETVSFLTLVKLACLRVSVDSCVVIQINLLFFMSL